MNLNDVLTFNSSEDICDEIIDLVREGKIVYFISGVCELSSVSTYIKQSLFGPEQEGDVQVVDISDYAGQESILAIILEILKVNKEGFEYPSYLAFDVMLPPTALKYLDQEQLDKFTKVLFVDRDL